MKRRLGIMTFAVRLSVLLLLIPYAEARCGPPSEHVQQLRVAPAQPVATPPKQPSPVSLAELKLILESALDGQWEAGPYLKGLVDLGPNTRGATNTLYLIFPQAGDAEGIARAEKVRRTLKNATAVIWRSDRWVVVGDGLQARKDEEVAAATKRLTDILKGLVPKALTADTATGASGKPIAEVAADDRSISVILDFRKISLVFAVNESVVIEARFVNHTDKPQVYRGGLGDKNIKYGCQIKVMAEGGKAWSAPAAAAVANYKDIEVPAHGQTLIGKWDLAKLVYSEGSRWSAGGKIPFADIAQPGKYRIRWWDGVFQAGTPLRSGPVDFEIASLAGQAWEMLRHIQAKAKAGQPLADEYSAALTKTLHGLLEGQDPRGRHEALVILRDQWGSLSWSPTVIATLDKMLQQPATGWDQAATRSVACEILGKFPDERAISVLLKALEDPFEHHSLEGGPGGHAEHLYRTIWWEADAALRQITHASPIGAPVTHVGPKPGQRQKTLAAWKGWFAARPAAKPLCEFKPATDAEIDQWIKELRSEDRGARRAAADRLGDAGPPANRAIPALIVALKEEVRRPKEESEMAATTEEDYGGCLIRVLAGFGKTAVPPLVEVLKKEADLRQCVLDVLGRLGPDAEDAVPAVASLGKDADDETRASAMGTLGKIGRRSPQAIAAISRALGDGFQPVRAVAVRAFGECGPGAKQAVPALIRAWKEEKDESVRQGILDALGLIGPDAKDAVPMLIEALRHKEPIIRWCAARALERIGSAAAMSTAALKEATADEADYVRKQATESLEQIEHPRAVAGPMPEICQADTPEALMGRLADAIDARDRKAMLVCFGVDPDGREINSNSMWVFQTLAALRLRDAMQARFGREATEATLKDGWLAAADTKHLRATRWTVEGNLASPIANDGMSDGLFRISGVIMGITKNQQGWHMEVSVSASVTEELRQIEKSQQRTKQAERLAEEVASGKYKTVDELISGGIAVKLRE